jgi:hypothetical protein
MMVHQATMKAAMGPILIPITRMIRNKPLIKKPRQTWKAKNNLHKCNWPKQHQTRNETMIRSQKKNDCKNKKGLKKKKKKKFKSKKKSKSKRG